MKYRSLAASAALVAAVSIAHAGVDTVTWIGPDGGSWNNALNWTPMVVPNNGGGDLFEAVVDEPLTVQMDLSATLSSLVVGKASTVHVLNNIDPTLAGPTVTNDGLILLDSAGSGTILGLNSPEITFTGSGVFEGSDSAQNVIQSIGLQRRLVNDVDHTFRGGMNLGNNNTFLTNVGLIEGTGINPMLLNLGGGILDNFNSGAIAANGGLLRISGTAIDSTGGEIRAENGGTVEITSSTIGSGLIRTLAASTTIMTGNSTLVSPVIEGPFRVQNNVDPTLVGDLVHDDVFSLESTGSGTILNLNSSPITLTGGGSLEGTDTLQNVVQSLGVERALVIADDYTVRGAMNLGNNNTRLTNNGLIEATLPAGIVLDLSGATGVHFNNALMVARAGSLLDITTTDLDNTLGEIRAEDGGLVEITSSTIRGGLIRTDPGGETVMASNSTLVDPVIEGPFRIPNNVDPTLVGDLVHDNVFSLEADGSSTVLNLNSSPITFTGGGSLEGTDSIQNVVQSLGVVRTLVVADDYTVRGAMSLGNNNTQLTNDGLIEATLPAGILLDLSGGTGVHFNNALMVARAGSLFRIITTDLDNTLGEIRAEDGGLVEIASSTIRGGLIRTDPGGETVMTANSTLVDAVIEGPFRVPNNVDPTLVGDLVHDDVFSLESTGSSTVLNLNSSPITLTGGGSLEGTDALQNVVQSLGVVRTLVVADDYTVRGAMSLGNNNTQLTNDGLIEATLPAGIVLDLSGGTGVHFNNALMVARSGSLLQITTTDLDNALGEIRAENGADVELTSSTVRNGLIHAEPGGAVTMVTNSTLQTPTIEGDFFVPNNVDPSLLDGVTNNGTIHMQSIGSATIINLFSEFVTLDGGGELVGSESTGNIIQSVGVERTFVNEIGHTIRGGFSIGGNNTKIVNRGTIDSDSNVGMLIDPTATPPGMVNEPSGQVLVTGPGGLTIQAGPFDNQGLVRIDDARTLTRAGGDFLQTDGLTDVDGTLAVPNGAVDLQGGVLGGNGFVDAPVSNGAGIVGPGGSTGILGAASYGQGAEGGFRVEIGGTEEGEYDRLEVVGTAMLAGTLFVDRVNDFIPSARDEFVILTAAERVGEFDAIVSCDLVDIVYTDTSVIIRLPQASGIPGDLNGDGMVNGADLGLLLGVWGVCTEACCPGDLNGDAEVNGADLGILLGNWG